MSTLNVTNIKAADGTSGLTIANSTGIVTPTKIAQSIVFQAKGNNSDMAYTASNGITKITGWNVTDLNVGNCWSQANSRFTPTVAGWYMFGGTIRGNFTTTDMNTVSIEITKNAQTNNGTGIKTQFQFNSKIITNSEIPAPSGLLYCNGSSDYVEMFFDGDENCTIHDGASRSSHFFSYLVHAT